MQQLVTQSLCAVGGKRDPSEDLQFLHCRYGVKLQAGFHLPGSGQITWTVSCFYPAVKQDCLKPLPPICAAPRRSVPHMVALVHPWCWWLAWCPLLNVQMRGLGWAWKRHWGRRWWNWEVVPRNAILETCPCIQGSLWSALFLLLDAWCYVFRIHFTATVSMSRSTLCGISHLPWCTSRSVCVCIPSADYLFSWQSVLCNSNSFCVLTG